MNRRTFILLLMLGALLPVMATRVAAQGREMVVTIPFNFTVCTQSMPAGKYTVRQMTSANTNLLLVRSEDGGFAEIACTHDVRGERRTSEGKLVFNRYRNQYFLAELWFPGDMTGNEVFKSQLEQAVINELTPKAKRGRVTIRVTEVKAN